MSTIDNISSNDRFSRYGLFIDDLDPVPSEDMKILGENSNRSSFKGKGFVPMVAKIWRGTCPTATSLLATALRPSHDRSVG